MTPIFDHINTRAAFSSANKQVVVARGVVLAMDSALLLHSSVWGDWNIETDKIEKEY